MEIPSLYAYVLLRRLLLPAALLLCVAQAHAGLLAHYTFNETSGTTAADSSGSGNTGTLTNMAGTEWAAGKVGGGLSFDGTNDGTGPSVRTSLTVDLDDALSLSAWVNVANTTSSSYNIFGAMTSATDYFMILPRVNMVGMTLQHRANPPAGGSLSTTPSQNITANIWTHIAMSKASGSNVKIYQNGVKITDESLSYTGYTPAELYIGGMSNGNNSFNGILDEIRVYDHALSAVEVSALAAGGGAAAPEPAETFAFLGLLTTFGLGFREWCSRRKAKAV